MRHSHFTILALAAAAAPFALLLLLACKGAPSERAGKAPPPSSPPAPPLAVFPDGHTVKMNLALTPEEQERGLMFVEELPDDRGMLFVYDTDEVRPFWMKNCKISMDFIWLSADGTVVDITRDVQPCLEDPCPTYASSAPSRYNLEVRGRLASDHGLKPGDRVVLRNLLAR